MYRLILRVSLLALLALAVALPVRAQDDEDDMALRLEEPEFTMMACRTPNQSANSRSSAGPADRTRWSPWRGSSMIRR